MVYAILNPDKAGSDPTKSKQLDSGRPTPAGVSYQRSPDNSYMVTGQIQQNCQKETHLFDNQTVGNLIIRTEAL